MLRIREYIEGYFERYSSVPTVREIAGAMRIAVSSAHRYLVAMAEKDMVFYENGTLSTPKIQRMNPAVSPAAIVGSIPCGSPEEKEARVEEYLGVRKYLPDVMPSENQVGLVTGLAWTSVGGVTLEGVSGHIEFDATGDAVRDVAYVKHCETDTGAWSFVTEQRA